MAEDGLRCERCGQMNPPGSAFCNSCGASLAASCPNCGRENPAGSAFCNACGTKLGAAPAQPAIETPRHLAERILRDRAGLEGERRNVTVLFIDAADSTATGSRVDPEVLHAVVRECTQRMGDAVHRFEGTVTQFRGDGIMAIFGAPIAHEDSARRAVAAALAMRESLVAYGSELTAAGRPSFRYRIGLHSGPVVVGRIGDDLSMDYTAIGDTVNLAARMEAAARNDSIYVTDAVYRQVRPYFEFRELGPLEVKGKAEAVEAYEVLRALPVRDRLEAVAAKGLSPFVGREQELAALKGYFEQARRGMGQVVFVTGEAGMGKSRLLLEFRASLEPDSQWFEGHCTAYGKTSPYLAINDALKSAFGVAEADTEEAIIGRVTSAVGQWDEAARPTASYLRFLLNVDPGDPAIASMEPGARRAGILDSLRALVLQASRGGPLVLLVEDLHWIDAQSQEALAALIDVIASAPVLMLLTFRPGYAQPFGDRSYFSRLSLRNLGAEESARISEAVLEGVELPAEVRDLIYRKAEGNPFYIEEVTKSLIESGALRPVDGKLVLTRPAAQVQIPDTIQGVILSRIDRLDRGSREAIQLASVIGREFTVRLLQRISDLHTHLDGLLGELKNLELIYEKAFFPELSYMFKHALTHDVAYSTLLADRRRSLHRMVAQSIEELYGERLAEHYEVLAHHFYEGEAWDKALDYLLKSARKALDAYAHAEALMILDRALGVLEQRQAGADVEQDRADILAYRGRARLQASAWAAARPDLEAALASLATDRIDRRLELLGDLAMACWWSRDTAAMRRYAGELREAAAGAGREDIVIVADGWLAAALSAEGDPLASRAAFDAVMERAGKIGLLLPAGPGSFYPLWNYWTARFDQAVSSGREAADRARRENNVPMMMEALPHFAVSLAANGEYAEALSIYAEARTVGQRYGVMAPLARVIAMEAGMHLDILDFAGAEAIQNEAREQAAAASFPPAAVSAGIDLLLNLARQGKPERAEALEPDIAAAVEREAGWHGWLWRLRLAQAHAELAVARGDWNQALEHAEDSIQRSIASGRVKYQVAALGARAAARAALGREDDAITDLRRGVDLARASGDPAMLLRALLPLAARRPDEDVTKEARAVRDRIAAALPESMRPAFLAAQPLAALS